MTCLIHALAVTLVVVRAAFATDEVAHPAPGLPLTPPAVLVGRHGQLHVDLTAARGQYTIGGERFQGMLYNNAYIPPVWRLEPGDTLTLECEFVRVRGPVAKGQGRALVGGELAVEALLTVFVGE